MTPKDIVVGVKKLAADWAYDAMSIGYLGPVLFFSGLEPDLADHDCPP